METKVGEHNPNHKETKYVPTYNDKAAE